METMSSQLTRPPVQHPEPPEKPKRIDLSASQVLGGALAAMTAAALGSRLGVAGTVIGAAVASVIAAVGGSVYTASIRASRERVKTVLVRRPSGPTDAAAPPVLDAAPVATELAATDPVEIGAVEIGPGPKRAWSWKTAAIGALAAFVLAAVAVTGFEVFTGNALSGGNGTTITQVGRDASGSGSGSGTRTDDSSTTPSASASDQPSASDSTEPSETPSTEPTPSASASEPATTEPSPSASASEPTPSASDTPTSTPSAGPNAG
jgi:hypothetical protein